MHVSANSAVHQRDKSLTDEHVPQADPEKQSVLVDTLRPESRHVERVGHECVGED